MGEGALEVSLLLDEAQDDVCGVLRLGRLRCLINIHRLCWHCVDVGGCGHLGERSCEHALHLSLRVACRESRRLEGGRESAAVASRGCEMLGGGCGWRGGYGRTGKQTLAPSSHK
jgi:hypothetical protein